VRTGTQCIFEEVVTIVRAVGEPPSDAFLGSAREQLTAKGSPLASSMFRDLNRGRPVEVEAIIGDLLRRGADAELTSPLLSAAYNRVRSTLQLQAELVSALPFPFTRACSQAVRGRT
jgi:ketopantoate reductase